MYDFDHPFSDALEGITHSLCSIEYTDHRPLYDWVVENALELMPEVIKSRPRQTEFARTLRRDEQTELRRLVEEGYVEAGTTPDAIAALRRRG